MNFRVVIMLGIVSLLTVAVTRSNAELDPTNYVEYQASHGGSSWRGRAPVEYSMLVVEGRLELNVIAKSDSFDSGNLMRDGLASAVVFESKTYPAIVFRASVNANVLNDDVKKIHLTATLAMHGITKEVTALVNLERNHTHLQATGTLEIKLSEYHMTRPSVAGFTINNGVTVVFNIVLDAEQIELVSTYL